MQTKDAISKLVPVVASLGDIADAANELISAARVGMEAQQALAVTNDQVTTLRAQVETQASQVSNQQQQLMQYSRLRDQLIEADQKTYALGAQVAKAATAMRDLCAAIEQLPASEQQTSLSVLASGILQGLAGTTTAN